jgi:predicted Ser/Thr protein kinase
MLAHLSDAERTVLEAWLVEFDLGWDADRLAVRARDLPPDGPLRLSALAEMVKIDLERQWQHGRRVSVEDYLRAFPELGPPDNPPLDLVETEVEVRTRLGDRPDEAELCERFPGCGKELRQMLESAGAAAQGSLRTPGPDDRPSTFPGPAPRGPLDVPAQFGRYRIRGVLGRGGMGTVYLADDTQLGRAVALKVPHFSPAGDPDARERFRREGRAAAALDHPHLCRVYDVGEHDGVPYLTMAYIEGRPLGDPAGGPLPPDRAAAVVRKVALALAYAHARGVVHRDLKPSNILVDAAGEPVVTDFGLARRVDSGDPQLSREGVPLGTPAYMSPEQVAGAPEAIGPATDVFSLGVILYHLLAGRLPFGGGPAEVMGRIVTETPPPPSAFRSGIDPRLEAACLKAMAKDPAARFASMDEFAAALAADREATPRRPWLAAAAVLVLAAVAAIVVIVVRGTRPEQAPGPDTPGKRVVGTTGGDSTPGEKPREVAPAPRPVKVREPVVFRGHDKGVTAVAFTADGKGVLSADERTIRRWDSEAKSEVETARKEFRAQEGFVFSPDGRRYLSHFGQSISLRDLANHKEVGHTQEGGPHTGKMAFAANGRRIVIAKMAVFGEVSALVWDPDENKTYRFTEHPKLEAIRAVALSADGRRGISGSKDGVRVWEVGSGKEQRHWPRLPVTTLAFTTDGRLVLTGNALGSLVLRDPGSGDEVGRFEGHTGSINAIALSPDGELLLSGSADGTARLWSVKERKELQRFEGHEGEVLSVALSADGRRALTGGKDGTVRLWPASAANR